MLQEPANPTFRVAWAPTISEKDAGHVPKKYDFNEQFDVLPLTGMKKELLFDRCGKQWKDSSSGKSLTKDTQRGDKGCINPEFKRKNKLSAVSKPWEIADSVIPYEHAKRCADNCFSFAQTTEWTNLKATSAGAGSTMYVDDRKPFTVTELRQRFGLYVLQWLAPSPCVEYKFEPQRRDLIAGNDMVYNAFHSNT